MNVFIAWKYSAILVTLDRALLRKAEALQSAIGAQVMHPRDVVELVRRKIQSRDRAARNVDVDSHSNLGLAKMIIDDRLFALSD